MTGRTLCMRSASNASGIATRDSAVGVTLTGLIIAGVAYFWREILAFFGGLSRKLHRRGRDVGEGRAPAPVCVTRGVSGPAWGRERLCWRDQLHQWDGRRAGPTGACGW
jgi:hypothetical protein